MTLLGERRRHAPPGEAGGEAGARGEHWLLRTGAHAWAPLAGKETFTVEAGARLLVVTPGGGAWGAPTPSESAP